MRRSISISSIPRSPDSVHPHRTRLTNLLWRERFAKGHIYKEGIPLLATPLKKTDTCDGSIMDTQTPYVPKAKRMAESYCEVVLPFRTDLLLREEYVNVFKGLRFGKLMEDLDALAASIAYKHAHDGRDGYLPLTIVTASVDRIDLLEVLRYCRSSSFNLSVKARLGFAFKWICDVCWKIFYGSHNQSRVFRRS